MKLSIATMTAAALVVLSATAHAEQVRDWKFWTLGKTQMAMELPTAPKSIGRVDVPGIGPSDQFEGGIEKPMVAYALSFSDQPLAGPLDYEAWGKLMLDVDKAKPGFLSGGVLPVPTPGLSSKFVCSDISVGGAGTLSTVVGMIGTPTHVVIVSITWDPRSEQAMLMTKRILDSFRLMPVSK